MPWRKIPISDAAKRRDQEAVETIHQSAMAGNELARVLGAETPLDRGLEQVAGLRNDRKHQRDNSHHRELTDTARIGDRQSRRQPPRPSRRARPPRSCSG